MDWESMLLCCRDQDPQMKKAQCGEYYVGRDLSVLIFCFCFLLQQDNAAYLLFIHVYFLSPRNTSKCYLGQCHR